MIEDIFGSPEPKPAPKDDFSSSFANALSTARQEIEMSAPRNDDRAKFYNPQSVDTFSSQDHYTPELFNPGNYQANIDNYTDMEDWGTTFGKAFDDFNYKFSNSFTEYWKSYGRLGKAIFSFDLSKMDPTQDEMTEQYYQDNLNEMKNHIFMKPEEEGDFFNKQFVKDFIGNSGFALGTFAGFGIELAADLAVELASAGTATPAILARLGMVGKQLGKLGKGFRLGNESAEAIRLTKKGADVIEGAGVGQNATRAAIQGIRKNYDELTKAPGFFENFTKLDNIPVLGQVLQTGKKVAAAGDAGLDLTTKLGIGLQGFRRSMAELNMSASEASFEAVSTYGDTLDKMVKEYEQKNGVKPTGTEFTEMQQLAIKASSANYNTNMALLLVANKLQFGNMFSKYLPSHKLIKEFAEEASEQITKVTAKSAEKTAGKTLTQLYTKGLFGTYGNFGKIAKEFGKKEAFKQMGKSFIKDVARFEVSEGIQENLQEMSAHGWKEYYSSAYSRDPKSVFHTMKEGLSDQFSQQGLKTFLQGALTGAIIHGPTTMFQRGLTGVSDLASAGQYKKNPELDPKKQLRDTVNTLNANFKNLNKLVFSDTVYNFKAQQEASAKMTAAAHMGDPYLFNDGKENALLAMVKTARRTGTVDALIDQVKQMGSEFSPEEFKEAFGVDIKDTDYGTVQSFTEKIANDIKTYSDTMDNVKRNMSRVTDPMLYKEGSKAHITQTYFTYAVHDAAEILALNKIKGNMAADRLKKLEDDIRSVPGFEHVSDTAFRAMTSFDSLVSEAGMLQHEIKDLEKQIKDTTDTKSRSELNKLKKQKEEEFGLLSEFQEFWDRDSEMLENSTFAGVRKKEKITQEDGTVEEQDVLYQKDPKVLKVLRKLVTLRNKSAGVKTDISEEALRDGFDKFVDYTNLSKDLRDYKRVHDALSDPDKYLSMVTRMMDGIFKAQVGMYLESIDDQLEHIAIFEKIKPGMYEDAQAKIASIRTSDPYVNLQVLLASKKAGVEQKDYAHKLADDLSKLFKDTFGVAEPEAVKEEEKAQVQAEEDAETEETTEESQRTYEDPSGDNRLELVKSQDGKYYVHIYYKGKYSSAANDTGIDTEAEADELFESIMNELAAHYAESKTEEPVVKETFEQTIARVQKLPYKDRIPELIKAGIVTDILIYGNRPVVVFNANGIKLPFYRSSQGTSGKTPGKWFPMFGFGKSRKESTELNWLIKPRVEDLENNFNHHPVIEQFSEIVNRLFDWEHDLDMNPQFSPNPYIVPHKNIKNDVEFNRVVFGKEDLGVYNDGEGSAWEHIMGVLMKLAGAHNKKNQAPQAEPVKKEPVQEKAAEGLSFKISPTYSAVWNRETKSFEFIHKTKGKIQPTRKLITELSKMDGIVNVWINEFLSPAQKEVVLYQLKELASQLQDDMYNTPDEKRTDEELVVMILLQNQRFKPTDAKRNTVDVNNKKWFSAEGDSIDTFVLNWVMPELEENGLLSDRGDSKIADLVYDVINKYPKGIKQADIKKKQAELNIENLSISMMDDFINEHLLDPLIILSKLQTDEKRTYKQKPEDDQTSSAAGEETTGTGTDDQEFEVKTDESGHNVYDNAGNNVYNAGVSEDKAKGTASEFNDLHNNITFLNYYIKDENLTPEQHEEFAGKIYDLFHSSITAMVKATDYQELEASKIGKKRFREILQEVKGKPGAPAPEAAAQKPAAEAKTEPKFDNIATDTNILSEDVIRKLHKDIVEQIVDMSPENRKFVEQHPSESSFIDALEELTRCD